jgi:pimeloyl-ACP methyl ester carboxylesterase
MSIDRNKDIPAGRSFSISDGTIHFLEWEDNGVDLHFLHANGMCAGTYSPFIERLRENFHIFASDVRGHGDSSPPLENPVKHWELFTGDLAEMIKVNMERPVIGIGHSLGAVVTYMTAAENPGLFSALVLIDPVFLPLKIRIAGALLRRLGLIKGFRLAKGARRRKSLFSSKDEALGRFSSGRGMFRHWDSEFIRSYLNCALEEKSSGEAALKCDPELEAQIYESFPGRIFRYAEKINCPVLAVRGEFSETFPRESILKLEKVLKNCKIATIQGAGHFIPMEKPDQCSRIVKEFLNSLDL